MLNVRAGGPYKITVRLAGFREQSQDNVNAALGEQTALSFRLQLNTVQETVTVTAEASPIFSSSKQGTSASVGSEALENLPTVSRSLQDFARTNPFVVQQATNSNPSALSIAGRSGRYNNIQIDGAVNNDLFGLADTATPGGQAEHASRSASTRCRSCSCVVSPYDVRQGGFSGGGINAITRSGSNRFKGTAYYFFRNQDWVGDGADDRPIATFNDKQFGGSIGGPMVRNKAFFFTNLEWQRRETPSGYSVDGSSGQTFGNTADAAADSGHAQDPLQLRSGRDRRVHPRHAERQVLRARRFQPGQEPADDPPQLHRRLQRHRHADEHAVLLPRPVLPLQQPDQFHRRPVEHARSARSFNEFRMSYQRIRDFRSNQTRVPAGQRPSHRRPQLPSRAPSSSRPRTSSIRTSSSCTTTSPWCAGAISSRSARHNEFFKFRNLFIRDIFGTYDFNTVELFEQGLAQSYDHSFSATSDPLNSARFWVYQFGFYGGDQWRLSDRFTLTYGLRVDFPVFPDTPNCQSDRGGALTATRTDVDAEHADVVAARRLQLGSELGRHHAAAGSRRSRPLRRPDPVRLAVEPVHEHRHRVHPHQRRLQRQQPHSVRARPEQPADDGSRRGDGDQRDQPRSTTATTSRSWFAATSATTARSAATWSARSKCCSRRPSRTSTIGT